MQGALNGLAKSRGCARRAPTLAACDSTLAHCRPFEDIFLTNIILDGTLYRCASPHASFRMACPSRLAQWQAVPYSGLHLEGGSAARPSFILQFRDRGIDHAAQRIGFCCRLSAVGNAAWCSEKSSRQLTRASGAISGCRTVIGSDGALIEHLVNRAGWRRGDATSSAESLQLLLQFIANCVSIIPICSSWRRIMPTCFFVRSPGP